MNSKYIKEIEKLPFFQGIKKDQLEEILQNSQLTNYKKNKILFLEQEKVKKFYIILNGSIKLTVNDAQGNEAILKMIDDGIICDLFMDNFSFSAKAVKDSQILTFPIDIFKKFIGNNFILLKNLLEESSNYNRELLSQLSILKIADGKQKVGQFLLKNSFNDGTKTNEFILEYSKSEIASYLGIRLETFSRLLHQLENEGEIIIEKNKIVLTNEKSLCGYCNCEIANKCTKHGEVFCEQ